MTEIDRLALRQAGTELDTLYLTGHGVEDHVAHGSAAALRVGADLTMQ